MHITATLLGLSAKVIEIAGAIRRPADSEFAEAYAETVGNLTSCGIPQDVAEQMSRELRTATAGFADAVLRAAEHATTILSTADRIADEMRRRDEQAD